MACFSESIDVVISNLVAVLSTEWLDGLAHMLFIQGVSKHVIVQKKSKKTNQKTDLNTTLFLTGCSVLLKSSTENSILLEF
jgi:hypothetical protein